MKTVTAIFLCIFIHAGAPDSPLSKVAAPSESSFSAKTSEEEMCKLSITGYGNYGELGRVKVTVSAEAATCEEAGHQLRAEVIKREIRLYE
ncbi:MAG: hypothetical protein R2824_01305 [Saprospiraceae bacterium]|nr:hypothetical protein [Lewinella sp.]